MPNGNCLLGLAFLLLVGDNSLAHELRVIAAVEQHVNATYYTNIWKHPISNEWLIIFPLLSSKSAKIETFSKLFDLYIYIYHLKVHNDRISEWTYFLNLPSRFQSYLKFSTPKEKRDFFREDLEGPYLHIWKEGVFFKFLGIKTHNFVKMTQNLKIRASFM